MEACTFPGLRVSNTFRGFTSGGPGEKNLSLPTWVCKTAWPAGSCEITGGGKPDSELQGCENVQLGGGNLTPDLRLAVGQEWGGGGVLRGPGGGGGGGVKRDPWAHDSLTHDGSCRLTE